MKLKALQKRARVLRRTRTQYHIDERLNLIIDLLIELCGRMPAVSVVESDAATAVAKSTDELATEVLDGKHALCLTP